MSTGKFSFSAKQNVIFGLVMIAVVLSKRLVYSNTAASPRFLTSFRILATTSSILSSCAVSKASNAFKLLSKSTSVVEKRLIFILFTQYLIKILFFGRDSVCKRIHNWLQLRTIKLQGSLIHNQARADVTNVFNSFKVVCFQCATCTDQIHNRIRQTN